MPYARKTLSQLETEAAQDIAGAQPGADPLLRYSNLGIMGKLQAAFAYLHYGYLDWISRMAVPFTAVGEYLYAWGGLKKVILKDATFATGAVTFTNCTVGLPIPAGTPLERGDNVSFHTTAAANVAGDGSVVLLAAADLAGSLSNTPAASVMTLGTAIPGMQSNGTVSTAFTGGNDIETPDNYRSRMLQRYQETPQGGANADYKRWALEVPGVTRAWVVSLGAGIGTVVVYTMWDVTNAAGGGFPIGSDGVAALDAARGIVATGNQLTVANYIYGDNNTARQPVTALVYSVAPIADVINFVINGIATVGADIKTQINAAIDGVFLEFGSPGGTIDLSDIEAAIAAIPGTRGFVITTPAGNIALPAGNLPKRGAVVYT